MCGFLAETGLPGLDTCSVRRRGAAESAQVAYLGERLRWVAARVPGEWRGLLNRVLAAAQQDGQLSPSTDLDRLADQIVALVDGFGLQGVLNPQHPQPEQLASRLNDAVDALIRAAEG